MYDETTTLNSGAPGYVIVAENGTERHFYSPTGGWLHPINMGGARLFADEDDALAVIRENDLKGKIPTRDIRVVPDVVAGL